MVFSIIRQLYKILPLYIALRFLTDFFVNNNNSMEVKVFNQYAIYFFLSFIPFLIFKCVDIYIKSEMQKINSHFSNSYSLVREATGESMMASALDSGNTLVSNAVGLGYRAGAYFTIIQSYKAFIKGINEELRNINCLDDKILKIERINFNLFYFDIIFAIIYYISFVVYLLIMVKMNLTNYALTGIYVFIGVYVLFDIIVFIISLVFDVKVIRVFNKGLN